MAGDPFRPSQVVLAVPPLCGTMGHAEREFAASLIVRACQARGDAWQPIDLKTLGEVLGDDLAAKVEPWASLNRNPFFRPDFRELADGTFGRWTGEPGESAIELTPAGVEALRRWVRPTEGASRG